MGLGRTIDANNVIQRTQALLAAHTKRAPQFANLDQISAELRALPDLERSAATQIGLARIAMVTYRFADAAQYLREHSDGDTSEDVASRAAISLEMAQMLGGKRVRGAPPPPKDIRVVFARLQEIAARHSEVLAQRIAMFGVMAGRQSLKAMTMAVDRAPRDPSAISDINAIVKDLFGKPYSATLKQTVKDILTPLKGSGWSDTLEDMIIFFDLEASARHARAGGTEPPSLAAVERYMEHRGDDAIRSLARAKDLFLSVYPQDEQIKLSIVTRLRAVVAAKPSGAMAKRLLHCASQTIEFWHDDIFRASILQDVLAACSGDDSGETEFVRGSLRFMYDDMQGAALHFANALPRSPRLALTGASSFFTNLTDRDEQQFLGVATRFADAPRVASAYVCCADEGFFAKHARAYAASARRFDSEARLHFHIASARFETASDLFDTHVDDIDNVSFSWEAPVLAIPTYYASMRFLRVEDFLANVADRIVLTDIDVEFRSSPDAFLNDRRFDASDVAFRTYDQVRMFRQAVGPCGWIYRYPRILPWSVVNAACLLVNDTEAGRIAAKTIARDMRRHLGRALGTRESAWWIDQNSLFASLRTILAGAATHVVNLETIGIPFGSFDSSTEIDRTSGHPALRSLAFSAALP